MAIAGLTVVLGAGGKGSSNVHENAIGMLAGCAGMVVYALAVMFLLRRLPALAASLLALVTWFAVAALVAWPVLA